MMTLSGYIVQEDTSIMDAAAVIDRNERQIVFVCDGMRLLASLADGDLRRYILRAGDPSQPVSKAANYKPLFLKSEEASSAEAFMKARGIRALPLLSAKGEIAAIAFADSTGVRRDVQLGVPVVIMAGGKGTRLAPHTDVLPKPLIPVGDKTITEHIMDRFLHFGCDDFTMIVNHKRALIKAYFNESPCSGTLRFVDENAFLGTGGGLKLLEGMITGTFFMTNCDILVEADYEDILNYHRERGGLVTMVCAMKKVSVPYGTVELDGGGAAARLTEKPEYPILTNTGLYVVEAAFLQRIKGGAFSHMTELIQGLIDEGRRVGVYPIREAGFMDMGQAEELEKMRRRLEGGA